MEKKIEVDLFEVNREENQMFFRLLDPAKWEALRAKLEDPENKLTIEQLVGQLLEDTL